MVKKKEEKEEVSLNTSVVLLTIIWLARRERKLGIRRRVVKEKGVLQHLNTGYDYNSTPNERKHKEAQHSEVLS